MEASEGSAMLSQSELFKEIGRLKIQLITSGGEARKDLEARLAERLADLQRVQQQQQQGTPVPPLPEPRMEDEVQQQQQEEEEGTNEEAQPSAVVDGLAAVDGEDLEEEMSRINEVTFGEISSPGGENRADTSPETPGQKSVGSSRVAAGLDGSAKGKQPGKANKSDTLTVQLRRPWGSNPGRQPASRPRCTWEQAPTTPASPARAPVGFRLRGGIGKRVPWSDEALDGAQDRVRHGKRGANVDAAAGPPAPSEESRKTSSSLRARCMSPSSSVAGTCNKSETTTAVPSASAAEDDGPPMAATRSSPPNGAGVGRPFTGLMESLKREAQVSQVERNALERRARRLGESLHAVQARCRRLERAEGERRRAELEVQALRKALNVRLQAKAAATAAASAAAAAAKAVVPDAELEQGGATTRQGSSASAIPGGSSTRTRSVRLTSSLAAKAVSLTTQGAEAAAEPQPDVEATSPRVASQSYDRRGSSRLRLGDTGQTQVRRLRPAQRQPNQQRCQSPPLRRKPGSATSDGRCDATSAAAVPEPSSRSPALASSADVGPYPHAQAAEGSTAGASAADAVPDDDALGLHSRSRFVSKEMPIDRHSDGASSGPGSASDDDAPVVGTRFSWRMFADATEDFPDQPPSAEDDHIADDAEVVIVTSSEIEARSGSMEREVEHKVDRMDQDLRRFVGQPLDSHRSADELRPQVAVPEAVEVAVATSAEPVPETVPVVETIVSQPRRAARRDSKNAPGRPVSSNIGVARSGRRSVSPVVDSKGVPNREGCRGGRGDPSRVRSPPAGVARASREKPRSTSRGTSREPTRARDDAEAERQREEFEHAMASRANQGSSNEISLPPLPAWVERVQSGFGKQWNASDQDEEGSGNPVVAGSPVEASPEVEVQRAELSRGREANARSASRDSGRGNSPLSRLWGPPTPRRRSPGDDDGSRSREASSTRLDAFAGIAPCA